MYYDKQGKPITLEQWGLINSNDGKRIGWTSVGGYDVSTVWVGIDLNSAFSNSTPLIYETMIFKHDTFDEIECYRVATESEARVAHLKAVYRAHFWSLNT